MENWCFDAYRTLRPWLNAYVPSQGHAARLPAVNLYLLYRFLNPDCLPQKLRGCQRLHTDTVELSVATIIDLSLDPVSPIHFSRSPIRRHADPPTRSSRPRVSVPESKAYALCQELSLTPWFPKDSRPPPRARPRPRFFPVVVLSVWRIAELRSLLSHSSRS